MSNWSRRDVLKHGLAAGATALTPGLLHALERRDRSAGEQAGSPDASESPAVPAPSPREGLRLDAGWRFTLGRGVDPTAGFGPGGHAEYAKGGNLFPASSPGFDASGWRSVDLPHDWALDLPFV